MEGFLNRHDQLEESGAAVIETIVKVLLFKCTAEIDHEGMCPGPASMIPIHIHLMLLLVCVIKAVEGIGFRSWAYRVVNTAGGVLSCRSPPEGCAVSDLHSAMQQLLARPIAAWSAAPKRDSLRPTLCQVY